MSTSASKSLSSSINSIKKTNKNNNNTKVYNKELNNLFDRIIKGKRTTFNHFQKFTRYPKDTKIYQTNTNNNGILNSNFNNEIYNVRNSSNKKTSFSQKKTSNKKNELNRSHNSSINEATSVSVLSNNNNNSNLKLIEFSKQINYFITNKNSELSPQDLSKRTLLIYDILNYVKTKKDLSALINGHDQFISDILELISIVNFSHIKYYPVYKIIDNNYNIIDSNINKNLIEELICSDSNNDAVNLNVIRLKRKNWQDILNLYSIFIELLNNLPTGNTLIEKLPLSFISNLIFSLQTIDNEERILIKLIIYKIYITSLTYRKYILKNISSLLIDVSNDVKTNLLCLDECLDLIRCIILGAKKPINQKYMYVVLNVVCPLLKAKNIYKQNNLKETIFKFMQYDKIILNEVLKFLLKSWPIRYPGKIIAFLDIIENIFTKNLVANVDENILGLILKKINCCMADLNFLIADRSIIFFKNENFINCLYKYDLCLRFIRKMLDNISMHWSQEIKIISKIVINRLIKKDENLMKNLTEKEKEVLNNFKLDVSDNEDIWDIQFNLKGD